MLIRENNPEGLSEDGVDIGGHSIWKSLQSKKTYGKPITVFILSQSDTMVATTTSSVTCQVHAGQSLQ